MTPGSSASATSFRRLPVPSDLAKGIYAPNDSRKPEEDWHGKPVRER